LLLEDFIHQSLNNSNYNEVFTIPLSDEVLQKISDLSGVNVKKYIFIIEAHSIRHIKNRHSEDLYLLDKIVDILQSFDRVQKSLTRNAQTGKTDISIVFEKRLGDGTVKMVALRIVRYKYLSLKTFFRKDM